MPVSTFTWTPAPAGATDSSARTVSVRYTVGVSPHSITEGRSSGIGSDNSSIGASIPASRRRAPSPSVATASRVAPPAMAASAEGTSPWP